MRKIFNVLIFFTVINLCVNTVMASNNISGLDENVNNLFMKSHFTQDRISNMYREQIDYFNNSWWPYQLSLRKELHKMETDSDEKEYNKALGDYIEGLNYSNGMYVTLLQTPRYAEQYANAEHFCYLYSDIGYWTIKNAQGLFIKYNDSGVYQLDIKELFDETKVNMFNISDDGLEFLMDIDKIEKNLLDKGVTEVYDMKLFAFPTPSNLSFLYAETDKGEFLSKIYAISESYEVIPNIKPYVFYAVADVIKEIKDRESEDYVSKQKLIPMVEKEKATFDTEAESLQSEGLLQGNENGLDLLKPLTRAEAVTLLVRALGLENETANYSVSQFTDIPSGNWAAPYAALAKARGIANGISETEFAPNERVTSDQFATFALRAIGESNFDYTEGTQILINKGIITEEQAETMDLFTRGDMAKIIYEVKEKGLL